MEYYSAIKKDVIIPFVGTWMDLEIIILSEVNLYSEKLIPYDIAYMWNLKIMIQINLFTKQNRLRDLENELLVTRGEGWDGGMDWEFGTDMYMLLYLKQNTNKDVKY